MGHLVNRFRQRLTVVALDAVGRGVGEKTVAATSDGQLALAQWARTGRTWRSRSRTADT